MGAKLERHARLSLAEGLALLGGLQKPDKRPEVAGVPCHTSGLRLYTFKTKGCKCVACGLEASFFAVEKSPGGISYHLNLYGIRDEREILFTHDHTLARSLGGRNTPENAETMCELCNASKAIEEGRLYRERAALACWKNGDKFGPKSMSQKEWERLQAHFDATMTRPAPPSQREQEKQARKNVQQKHRKRLQKESAMIKHIEAGGILEGSFETFTAHALYGHFTSAEVWERIQQHLVEKREFPGGVVFGARKKQAKPQRNPAGQASDPSCATSITGRPEAAGRGASQEVLASVS